MPSNKQVREEGARLRGTYSPCNVDTKRVVTILLSTGEPHDEFRCALDNNGNIERIEYLFRDWFDGAVRVLLGLSSTRQSGSCPGSSSRTLPFLANIYGPSRKTCRSLGSTPVCGERMKERPFTHKRWDTTSLWAAGMR